MIEGFHKFYYWLDIEMRRRQGKHVSSVRVCTLKRIEYIINTHTSTSCVDVQKQTQSIHAHTSKSLLQRLI